MMKLLNKDKIAELAQEIGKENVPMLFDIFLSELKSYSETLQASDGESRASHLKEISHALKSSAASFGADILCDIAVDIDAKGKNNELNDVLNEQERLLTAINETYTVYSDTANFQ